MVLLAMTCSGEANRALLRLDFRARFCIRESVNDDAVIWGEARPNDTQPVAQIADFDLSWYDSPV